MGHVRPGVGSFRRRFDARLGAGHGPPARGILRQVTHLAAAERSLRMRAATVAGAGRHVAETAGGIGRRRQADESGGKAEVERQPESNAAKSGESGGSHGEEFHAGTEKNR